MEPSVQGNQWGEPIPLDPGDTYTMHEQLHGLFSQQLADTTRQILDGETSI